MIEIEDLKKVKLEDDDMLVLQLKDSIFHNRSFREALIRNLRRNFRQECLIIPESVKLGVINKNDIDKLPFNEIEPILFDPNDLDGGVN